MGSARRPSSGGNRLIGEMIQAARLDRSFFEQVEGDPGCTKDAWLVVLLVSALGGLGVLLPILAAGKVIGALGTSLWTVLWGLIAFFLLSFSVQWVGTQFFGGQGDPRAAQRGLGFAYTPRLLCILAFLPCIGNWISLIGWFWFILAGCVAMQEALNQDVRRAFLTVIVAAALVIVLGAIIRWSLGTLGMIDLSVGGLFL